MFPVFRYFIVSTFIWNVISNCKSLPSIFQYLCGTLHGLHYLEQDVTWSLQRSGSCGDTNSVLHTQPRPVSVYRCDTGSRDCVVRRATWLGVGQSTVWNPAERPNRLWGPTRLLFGGYRNYFLTITRPGRNLTTHFYLMCKLGMSGVMLLFPLYAFMAWNGENFIWVTDGQVHLFLLY